MKRRFCAVALASAATCVVMFASARQAAAATIDQAVEISQRTGRPIFAVAGTQT